MADQYRDLTHEAADIDSAIESIASHVNDSTAHVTSAERESWNGKADEADLLSLQTVVEAKQDALSFDETTVKDSGNSVTSGGIWSAIWSQIFGVNSNKNLSQDVPDGGYDCDTLTDVGIYRVPSESVARQIANLPAAAAGRLIVMNLGMSNRYLQIYVAAGARFFMRSYISTGWQQWFEYAGTAVQTSSTNSSNSEMS